MATLSARKQAISQYVEARLAPDVADLQAAYRAAHGGYFQGVWTHDDPIPDGQPAPPDLSRRPVAADRADGLAHSWLEVGAAGLFPGNGSGAMDARVSVDEYAGPFGDGYVIRAQLEHGGTWWERIWAAGGHASDWPTGWVDATPYED